MKKLFTFFALALVAVGAFAEVGDEFKLGDLYYQISNEDKGDSWVLVIANDDYKALSTISIPAQVTHPTSGKTYGVWGITSECFKNCTNLTSVTIADGVPAIYSKAFNGCSNLKFVRIPDTNAGSNVTIANDAFYGSAVDSIYLNCTDYYNLVNIGNSLKDQLRHITFSGSFVNVGSGSFSYHVFTKLESVIFSAGVKKITSNAFSSMIIKKVEFPSSLMEFEDKAFYECPIEELTIPEKVEAIADGAFEGCSALKKIFWNTENFASGSTDYVGPFDQSGNNEDSIIVIVGANLSTLTKAFHDIDLVKKVDFSNCTKLTSIAPQALYGNRGIKKLDLPEGLTTIGLQSIAFCDKLKAVELPSSLTSIGAQAFDSDPLLTKITCKAITPPTLANANAFSTTTKSNATLYVPAASIDAYKTAWGFTNVEAIKVKVSFDLNGQTGTAPETQNVDLGGYATEPTPAPTATGYKFVGWYTTKEGTGSAFDFASTTVNADMTLYAKWLSVAFTLTEGDNTANLATFDGVESIVTVNRGFVADGGWYTLCLPFNMDATLIAEKFGACRIAKLTEVRDKGEGNYYFNFDDVTEIEAGVPYMFKPEVTIAANWVVNNVMVSKDLNPIEFTNASMAGVYNTETLPSGAYYLGNDDYLYAYKSGVTTKSLRAYFQFNTVSPVSARAVFSGRTITTDLDDAVEKAAPKKMLQNGQILIQNDGKVFNIFGLQVK